MAKRNEGEVSPVVVLWTYSANKEGLHPVKLRITFQRRREYYQVLDSQRQKLFLSAVEFAKIVATDKAKLRGKNRVIRETIDKTVADATDAIAAATNHGKDPFSFGEFERKYLGEEAGSQFLKFFKAYLKSIETKQAGTARVYGSVLHSFGKFINNGNPIIQRNERRVWVYTNHKDIDPADITPELLGQYEDKLRDDGGSDTWISICMRSIRAIYNRLAAKDDYLKMKYPFSRTDYDGNYKIPISSGQKGQTLSKEEMKNFVHGKVPGEEVAENPYYRAKLLFLFSFYAQGVNFKDMALLKGSNIKGNVIEFERQKTIRTRRKAIAVRIPITKELTKILNEIRTTGKNNYLFGVFNAGTTYTEKQVDAKVLQFVKTTNKWLKKYCEHNQLPVISTYASRHTFASLAKVHLPLAQISKMLGHSKIETTQLYLGRFEDDENRAGLMKVFRSIKKKSA